MSTKKPRWAKSGHDNGTWKWSDKETAHLKKSLGKDSYKDIAARLGRTENSVMLRVQRLKLAEPNRGQKPGKHYVFGCGCSGVLPDQHKSNKFAIGRIRGWDCRVSIIIRSNIRDARLRGHKSINSNTPHSVIRALMQERNCERCRRPLVWKFGHKFTPHLHHRHSDGRILGFTHPRCNTQAMEDENERLKLKNERLKAEITRLRRGKAV